MNKRKIGLNFLIPFGLGHPYFLPWSSLLAFREQFNDTSYTHFLYLEDDIKVSKANIIYWLAARESLKEFGFYPSFLRKELNETNNEWYCTDVMSKMAINDCQILNISETSSYISIVYPLSLIHI